MNDWIDGKDQGDGTRDRGEKLLKEAKAAEAAWVPTPLQELASPEHALAAEAAATESPASEPLVETPSLLAFETADEEVTYLAVIFWRLGRLVRLWCYSLFA